MNLRISYTFAILLFATSATAQSFDDVCTRSPDGGFLGAPFTVSYALPVHEEPETAPPTGEEDFFTDGPDGGRGGGNSGASPGCSGGGIVGALNCVTQQIENAGSGDGSEGGSGTSESGGTDGTSSPQTEAEVAAEAEAKAAENEVRITYTMRPKFIPGAPSRVVLVPEGRTGITRPEVFSDEDAQRIAPKVVELSRSILTWSPTLDETQTENLIDGALFAVQPPITLDGVNFSGFGKTDGEDGDAGFAMPAECASLFRSFTERAELLQRREW